MEDVFLCFEDFENVENTKNRKKSKTRVFLVFFSEEGVFLPEKTFLHMSKKDTFLRKEQKTPRVSLLAEENPQTGKNSKKCPTR